jgi:hypothetical protein
MALSTRASTSNAKLLHRPTSALTLPASSVEVLHSRIYIVSHFTKFISPGIRVPSVDSSSIKRRFWKSGREIIWHFKDHLTSIVYTHTNNYFKKIRTIARYSRHLKGTTNSCRYSSTLDTSEWSAFLPAPHSPVPICGPPNRSGGGDKKKTSTPSETRTPYSPVVQPIAWSRY